MSRSRLAEAICLVVTIVISANVAHCNNLKTTQAPIVIKTTPGAAIGHEVNSTGIVVHNVTAIKPASQNNALLKQELKGVPQVTSVPASLQSSTAKPVVAAVTSSSTKVELNSSPADRLSQYFAPVCNQLENIQPKQLFKIQSQLKQFVEKTAGKMSLCFMQTFSIDPTLAPVNKLHLKTICSSRNLNATNKGSFKSFLDCAERHYDPMLDAELVRIQKSRASLGVNHDHSKDNLANLPHDDDELSLINEVVNKVISDSKVSPLKTDVKVVDSNSPKNNTTGVPIVLKPTVVPVVPVSKSTTATPVAVVTQTPSLADKLKPSNTPDKNLLNDPNTMFIIVDDSPANATTKPSQKSGVVPVLQTTVAPRQVAGTTLLPVKLATTAASMQAILGTTAKPLEVKHGVTTPAPAKLTSLGEKVLAAADVKTTAAPAKTTAAPAKTTAAPAKTTAAPAKTTAAPTKTVIVVTKVPDPTSTAAPVKTGLQSTPAPVTTKVGKPDDGKTKKPEGGSTAPPKSSSAPAAATSAHPEKTTEKPIKKVVKELKKQEKEKEAEKKEDDLDAKKAMKSLQEQRAQAHGSPADIRMHQIEHERQMSIDPIGHTIKHQEYEKKKAGISVVKAASTTKKPQ